MPSRRWLTAWRLFRSGKLKELLSRPFHFLSSAGNKKNEITYSEWREKWVELNEEEKQSVEDRINSFPLRLSFTLLLDTQGHDSADVFQTIKSLMLQLYPNWLLWIMEYNALDIGIQEKILELQDGRIKIIDTHPTELGDWVIELTPGTELHETALIVNAFSAINNPVIELMYSDHDHIDPSGKFCDPYLSLIHI